MASCSYPNCDKPIFVKKTSIGELCNGHYKQYREAIKKGNPIKLTDLRKYKPRDSSNHAECIWKDPSTNEKCDRPCWGNHDYCQTHQRQKWSGKSLQPIRRYSFQMNKTCSEEGCSKPAKAMELCAKHYSKSRNLAKKTVEDK